MVFKHVVARAHAVWKLLGYACHIGSVEFLNLLELAEFTGLHL